MAVIAPATAKTEIQGDRDAMIVRVDNASVDETLKALGASFNLHFHAPGPLAKSVSGSYQGSLKDVVKRLLNGYDFVLTTRGAAIEVAVIGKNAAPAPAGGPNQTPASFFRPAAAAQQTPPALAPLQVAALAAERMTSRAKAPAEAEVSNVIGSLVPRLMAEGAAMPMPIKQGVSMPMLTPSASPDSLMPKPSASGFATMPMPDTSGNVSVPMLSPANQSSDTAKPVSMPKPN